MKRLSTGVLAALFVSACGLTAVAAPSNAQTQGNAGNSAIAQSTGTTPAADFGTPPSGSIPILYNDHHVYSKPDVLKQGRVLAALVMNGTVLIPLRSMFEQMGATVSYDAGSKTATVSKPGAQVQVTVGKPEVVINGESRPLDVPPMIYKGAVLVPIRVISEGMGAYVQWVPDQRVVVVRYIPATPPPTPAPTAPPTTAPTPTPVPSKAPYKDLYVAGDYIISPKVYNEFSPGNQGTNSFAIHGAFEFNLFNLPWMLEGAYSRYQYPHNCNGYAPGTTTYEPSCYVTGIGGGYSTPVLTSNPPNNQDIDAHFGLRVAKPRIYIGVGYLWATNNYGYPKLNNVGFGAEKLPDLDQALSVFGSIYYYPNVNGNFSNTAVNYNLAYNVLKYQAGLTYVIGKSPIFVEAGWIGEDWTNKQNAPSNQTFNGPFAGLGVKF